MIFTSRKILLYKWETCAAYFHSHLYRVSFEPNAKRPTMALTEHSHMVPKLAVAVLFTYALYSLLLRISLARKRRAFANEKGALPAPQYPQYDKRFGYDLFKENMRAFKQRNFLNTSLNRFREMGVNTYEFIALGRRMYNTTEPENLKAIQAVDFKNWGLGSRRKTGFRPLLGDGEWAGPSDRC